LSARKIAEYGEKPGLKINQAIENGLQPEIIRYTIFVLAKWVRGERFSIPLLSNPPLTSIQGVWICPPGLFKSPLYTNLIRKFKSSAWRSALIEINRRLMTAHIIPLFLESTRTVMNGYAC
jgi:hypothetical protein